MTNWRPPQTPEERRAAAELRRRLPEVEKQLRAARPVIRVTQPIQPAAIAAIKNTMDNAPFMKDLRRVSDETRERLRQLPEMREIRASLDRIFDSLRTYGDLDLEALRRRAEEEGVWETYAPPNWVDLEIDDETHAGLGACATDGIPIAYVPRADILALLAKCPDYKSRCEVLLTNREALLDDCEEAIAILYGEEDFEDQIPLAKDALAALRGGHDSAAQALAINVTEAIIGHFIPKKQPTGKVKALLGNGPHALFDDVSPQCLRFYATLLALKPWLKDWEDGRGQPAPETLSRHTSVHQARTVFYTTTHAITAVLVMASVAALAYEVDADLYPTLSKEVQKLITKTAKGHRREEQQNDSSS